MSEKCIVIPLLQMYTKEQLLNEYFEHFQKMITKCKCADHINDNPIELPSISVLHQQLTIILGDLMDFGFEHLKDDSTGSSRKLISFIQQNCLSDSPSSLFSILDILEKKYG
jgi:hypothetical protein